jgi:hypothetical protein
MNETEGGGTSVFVHDQASSAVRTKGFALCKSSRYFPPYLCTKLISVVGYILIIR